MTHENLNGFVPTQSGWVKFQASPSAHYGGTCWCDGWHITATQLPGGEVCLRAVNVQRHDSRWTSAEAVIDAAAGRTARGDFPWELVRPIRVWPAREQRARRVGIAQAAVNLRVDGPAGEFVILREGRWYAAVLAATRERVLKGRSRKALLQAIRRGRLVPGVRVDLFAYWIHPMSGEWRRARAVYDA